MVALCVKDNLLNIFKYIDTICNDCKNAGNSIEAVECREGLHHKSELELLGTIPYDYLYNSTCTNILFTGYKTCYGEVVRDDNGNIDINETFHQNNTNANGWTSLNCNRILILAYTRRNDLNNDSFDAIIRTTAHEALHTLGVVHCDKSEPCIMSSASTTVSENLLMCDICKETVNSNKLRLYHHQ